MTEGGTWASLKAYNSAVVGNAFILGRVPAQEGIEADTAPAPGLGSEAGSEPVFVESTEPPVARLVSGLNPGLRSPLLKQAAMANILADLRRNYGLENMAQSGSLSWSFAWQRSLASSKKTASLLACNKMSRWSSICASADTNTFSVYFRGS